MMWTKQFWMCMALAVVLAPVCGLVSCTSDKPEPAKAAPKSDEPVMTYKQGEAGGTIEETVKATATVTAVDQATRRITLSGDNGFQSTFTARPEIRNFDKIHVGDKVHVTLNEKMVIFVDQGGESPSVTHAAALARAPKGARPGAIVAEGFEVVAKVTAIDKTNQRATLQFVDGSTQVVPVRRDVDLARYKVGDNVVIQVTQQLSVLVP